MSEFPKPRWMFELDEQHGHATKHLERIVAEIADRHGAELDKVMDWTTTPPLDCHECTGRGFVKQPRRLVGYSFDPCPRCAGTGKEGLRG